MTVTKAITPEEAPAEGAGGDLAKDVTWAMRSYAEVIDRFIERCHELGIAPNKALADFIANPVTTIRPSAPAKKKAEVGNPMSPLAKPTGFDAITGEPIFKSGVGPRGGKKK